MAGFHPASVTLVGTNTPEKHVGYAMGIISTSTAAGGILGPLAGGVISQWVGLRGCFVASCILTLVSALIVMGVRENHAKRESVRTGWVADLKTAAATPRLMRIYGLILLVSTSVMVLEPLLTLYVVSIGGNPDTATLSAGIVFSAVGVATVIMGPRWGRLGGKLGYDKTLMIGLLGGGIGNLLQVLAFNLYMFGGVRFVYGLFFAAVYPTLNAMVVRYAALEFRGRAVSLSQSANQFGIVLGPLIGGFLGGWAGIPIVFLLTGIALLVAAWTVHRSAVTKQEQTDHGTVVGAGQSNNH